MIEKKVVAITGGCGYIGSHIAKHLMLSGDYRVIIVDRVKRKHTLKFCDVFIHADIDSIATENMLHKENPSVIIHCAGYISVKESMSNPAMYYNNNVVKTIKFISSLKHMKKNPNIIFSSSAAVYGDPSVTPINENSPLIPVNTYGFTKMVIERMLSDYATALKINSVSLRYFNACGADKDGNLGQEKGAEHIIAKLLEACIANDSFVINGDDFNTMDGTCIRDYVHVDDLANAHINAMKFLDTNNGAWRFNLGTGVGYSNADIVNFVLKNIKKIPVTYGPKRTGDPAELVADAHRARKLLGWTPSQSDLRTIIMSAWKWYNK